MTIEVGPRVVIRDELKPGDLGWVIGRHGALYASEYDWTIEFEVLVAGIATAFFAAHDPAREHGWYAELEGRTVGCVFLVRVDDRVAKLRMLIVEPEARGFGIGRALIATCLAFARAAGYETVTLWTKSTLLPARKLYVDFGFELVESTPNTEFGHTANDETWILRLAVDRRPSRSQRGSFTAS